MEIRDQGLGVLDRPRPRDGRDDQAMLVVRRHVIPVVPLVVVGRVGAVDVRLLLGDEGPLLIELDLSGKPRVSTQPLLVLRTDKANRLAVLGSTFSGGRSF
jgi:hypothetical protein